MQTHGLLATARAQRAQCNLSHAKCIESQRARPDCLFGWVGAASIVCVCDLQNVRVRIALL